jgi:hypothetical protein
MSSFLRRQESTFQKSIASSPVAKGRLAIQIMHWIAFLFARNDKHYGFLPSQE